MVWTRIPRSALCAAALMLLTTSNVLASPQVFHVETDITGKLLTIHGNSFGAVPGRVKLGEPEGDTWIELAILFWSPNRVEAQLPDTGGPGSFRLRVADSTPHV